MSNSVRSLKEMQLIYENKIMKESIFDGNVDNDGKEKEEEGNDEKDTSTADNTENKSEKDADEKDESEKKSSDDKGSDSSDKKDGDSKESKVSGSSIKGKVKSLQKQYNDLLLQAFEKHACDCIDQALSEMEGTFGDKINEVLDKALAYLKKNVLDEFGVKEPEVMDGGVAISIMSPEIGVPGDESQALEQEPQPTSTDEEKEETGETEEKDESEDSDEDDKDKDEVVKEESKSKNKKFKPRWADNTKVDTATKVHKNLKDKNKEKNWNKYRDWMKNSE